MKTSLLNEIPSTIEWKDNTIIILDQTLLPLETKYIHINTIEAMWDAIKRLAIRGAGALSVGAAYGIYFGIERFEGSKEDFFVEFDKKVEYIRSCRPTAVKLFKVCDRMTKVAYTNSDKSVGKIKEILLDEAHKILDTCLEKSKKVGEYGLELMKNNMTILTHCNAGSYAGVRYGSALAPIYLAREKGWNIRLFADETRPLLQGARLTTHEMMRIEVDVTLICDNMAGHIMKKEKIDAIFVGCDRMVANGDFANKIGTYGLAVMAKHHNIPFYTFINSESIDFETETGEGIPIEERPAEEVTEGFGTRTAPNGVKVCNPAFDVTPNNLLTGIVTEKGIIYPPFKEELAKKCLMIGDE